MPLTCAQYLPSFSFSIIISLAAVLYFSNSRKGRGWAWQLLQFNRNRWQIVGVPDVKEPHGSGHIDKPRNFCQPAEVPRGRQGGRTEGRERKGGKSAMCVVFVVFLDQWESGFGSGRSLNADKQNFLAAKLLTGWSSYLLPRHPALSVCVCMFVCVFVTVCVNRPRKQLLRQT